jgi:GT2 family glycosyltransferase
MVGLSIVIVSWNTKSYVEDCLRSLCQQTLSVPTEIILVDNASADGTLEMVRRQFPLVKLIENAKNLGFAKANNIGIRKSTHDYVCLINSDVYVPPACMQALYKFMKAHPEVGVVGPRMFGPNGCVARSYMRFPTIWNCLCNALCLDSIFRGISPFGGVLMTDFDNEKTAEVDVLNGWFLMVRRKALDQVGVLDEEFFMYGEDIDWAYRFSKAGWVRVYFAGARALHYGGASSAAAPIRFYIEKHRANIQYWKKHHGRMGLLGYWLTTLVHHIIRVGAFSFLYLLRPGARSEAYYKVRRGAACIWWLLGLRSANAT